MTSLKRSLDEDPSSSNISSKVFVRSTKSGKVQKITRELYLRQDIPCSSRICSSCLKSAPQDASGKGMLAFPLLPYSMISPIGSVVPDWDVQSSIPRVTHETEAMAWELLYHDRAEFL